MSIHVRSLLFFGVHVQSVDFERLVQVPELSAFSSRDIKQRARDDKPLARQGLYICHLGDYLGWAISATVPEEVGPLKLPLDAFAGDRELLLRVARAASADARSDSYVGWQVVLGYY